MVRNHDCVFEPAVWKAGGACRTRSRRLALALAACALLWITSSAAAQGPRHYLYREDMPPGTVGQGQLIRNPKLANYFQPVEIQAPDGAWAALATDGYFQPPQPAPVLAGMLVGQVYRFKVTNIFGHEGAEVFPTIELIGRLYPPPGLALRFPIPIEVTQEDLELAIRGHLVTRVIYVEHPDEAFPEEQVERQRWFEVAAGDDLLRVADQMGRPVAILRMGSRVPDMDQATGQFLFSMPPIKIYPQLPEQPERSATSPPDPPLPNVPRVALPPGGTTSGEPARVSR